VIDSISSFFKVNILCFDDVRDKKVYGRLAGDNLKSVLDSLAWLLGVDYTERNTIYFFGSNAKTSLVLPLAGLSKDVENVFNSVSVKVSSDKLVLSGSERDLAKAKTSYIDLTKKHYTTLHLYAVEVVHDSSIDLGLDIDKAIRYSFSWESLAVASYNPFQSLAISLSASAKASSNNVRLSSIIDTDIGLLSGSEVVLQVGEDIDRAIYNNSNYGDRVVSGYSTQKTGLILKLSGYFDDKQDWFINFSVENSEAKTETKKSLTTLNTISRLSPSSPVAVLAQLTSSAVSLQYTKGLPYISDIPYIGFLFRLNAERTIDKRIFFVLVLRDAVKTPAVSALKPVLL
jgi:hypothetical protein